MLRAVIRRGERLADFRKLGGADWARRVDGAWAEDQTRRMPTSWAGRLLAKWGERFHLDQAAANLAHLHACTAIDSAHRAGVPADASDADVCEAAHQMARDMGRRLDQRGKITAGTLAPAVSPWSVRWAATCEALAAYAEALHWLALRGLQHLTLRGPIDGILRRLRCERWWRRVLRRIHAQAVEATARRIGLVHKRAGCYVSNEGLTRRTAQVMRNHRALESVQAINDKGQDYTLADLAARGPANREIRRHELMTRIAGFELIAKDLGHRALFVTVTCPSRMHAWRNVWGSQWDTEPNPKHDGTRPDQAQQHLTKSWARFRAWCQRMGLDLYGFRISEPNHDGTPHWHAVLFLPERPALGVLSVRAGRAGMHHWGDAACMVEAGLRRYFLSSADGTERGAIKHRVRVEPIDWTKGSAAGYVLKYVAKNIDGYKVGEDLYGNPAIESSRRVDAWASTWRIRQFQQIGGAPVGVWRELRRVHPDQAGIAPAVALALEAVNAGNIEPGEHTDEVKRHTAAHGWQTYTTLQGGPKVRRAALRVRVLTEATGEVGRYGEPMAARPVGVWLAVTEREKRPALGIVPAMEVTRQLVRHVESERSTWTIAPAASMPAIRALLSGSAGGEAARPRSPVINCTQHPARIFSPTVQRSKKIGRWADWSVFRTGEKVKPESNHDPHSTNRIHRGQRAA